MPFGQTEREGQGSIMTSGRGGIANGDGRSSEWVEGKKLAAVRRNIGTGQAIGGTGAA
jgi:hypothetical protein